MNWPRHLVSLSSKNFRLYFFGQTISLFGTWMNTTASLWLVYHLSSSAMMLGLVGFAGQIPIFLFAPFAGVWVDRVNRHRLLTLTQILAMLQSFTLAAMTYGKVINVESLVALTFIQGMINGIDMPARQALTIAFVERKEHLANAIAINTSMFNLARLAGPAMAGFVIVKTGPAGCFLVDGLSYLAVIFCLLAMRLNAEPKPRAQKHPLIDLREGFHYTFTHPPIRAIIITTALISFLGFWYGVLMPIYARDVFHGGPQALGYLMSSVGMGALGAGIYLGSRITYRGLGKVITIGSLLLGTGLIIFALSTWFVLSEFALAMVGMGGVLAMASGNTLVQTLVEEEKRGRVLSIFTMAFTGPMPLGSLVAGVITHRMGPEVSLVVAGILCALAGWHFYRQIPGLRAAAQPMLAKIQIPEQG